MRRNYAQNASNEKRIRAVIYSHSSSCNRWANPKSECSKKCRWTRRRIPVRRWASSMLDRNLLCLTWPGLVGASAVVVRSRLWCFCIGAILVELLAHTTNTCCWGEKSKRDWVSFICLLTLSLFLSSHVRVEKKEKRSTTQYSPSKSCRRRRTKWHCHSLIPFVHWC